MSWVDTDPKYAFLGGKDRWENSSSVNSGPQGASQASWTQPAKHHASWSELCYMADDDKKEHLTRCIPPDESMLEEQNIIAEVDTVYMSVME